MSTYVIAKVGAELANALVLRELLREYEDPQLVLDAIEGSTSLHEALCVAIEQIGEEEMQLAGIETKQEELTTRATRIKTTIERLRDVVAKAMERAEIKTIKSPTATFSLRQVPPKLMVTDEERIFALHPALFVEQKPKLDMKALRSALESGEQVGGVEWGNGSVGLTIRRA
jgi:hypothetical protein